MKFKYWALSLLACGGMLSCTNEDVVDSSNGKGETSTSYLAVNVLNAGAPGTRAVSGYEDGTADENEISNMSFYLFNSDGSAYTLTDGTNRVSPTYEVGTTNDKVDETVEEIGKSVLVINGSTATPPATIVAVLNLSDPASLNNKSLTELKAIYSDYSATGKGNFIMSNSVYADGSTIGEVSLNGKLTNDADEALANPVDIYVERVLAKVNVTFDKANRTIDSKPAYLLSGTDGDADAVYAQVVGWQIADYRDKSYILKNIDNTWTDDNLGISAWSIPGYHRSFWAKSVSEGSVIDSYSWTNMNGHTADVYTQENTPTAGNTDPYTNSLTKVVVAVKFVDINGTEKPRYQYMGVTYPDETAILNLIVPNFNEYYVKTGETSYRQIAASELKFKSGNNVVGGDSYRAYPQLKETFDADDVMDGEETKLYTTSDGQSFSEVTDKSSINTALENYHAQIWTKGNAYYYTTIKHLGGDDKVGEYGVVRNHVYKVIVSDISGWGTPVYDPNEVIVPVRPEDDESYLAARINILAWRVVSNTVTLE